MKIFQLEQRKLRLSLMNLLLWICFINVDRWGVKGDSSTQTHKHPDTRSASLFLVNLIKCVQLKYIGCLGQINTDCANGPICVNYFAFCLNSPLDMLHNCYPYPNSCILYSVFQKVHRLLLDVMVQSWIECKMLFITFELCFRGNERGMSWLKRYNVCWLDELIVTSQH